MAKYPKIQGKEPKIIPKNSYNSPSNNMCFTNTKIISIIKTFHLLDQVQEELSRVIGSRKAQVEDRTSLPFTDAVIHETQRLANIVPMAIPHKTSEDVTFQGHFIKKVRMNEQLNLENPK